MKKLSTIVAAAALAFAFAAPVAAFAESAGHGAIHVAADHSISVKSLIGAPVYNDTHQKIGTIETVMVKDDGGEPMAVLSVGEFLGHGPKTVAVPMTHLQVQGDDTMVMAGATRAVLDSLPVYAIAGG